MSTEKAARVIPFPRPGLAATDARATRPRAYPPLQASGHRVRLVAAAIHAALPDAIILIVTLASMLAAALLMLAALGLRAA